MSEDWSVRDDALRLYREDNLEADQIAERLGIDADRVRLWIAQNGRLKSIHRPRAAAKLKARRMRVLELSANNYDDKYIARVMGLADRTNVARLRGRALEELAAELADQKAWEKSRAMHLSRVMALLTSWWPSAVGDDEAGVAPDPKFADLVLKALAQIAQVSGYNTIHVHNTGDDTSARTPIVNDDVQAVLASLETTAARLGSGHVINGQIVGVPAQPGGDLPSQ